MLVDVLGLNMNYLMLTFFIVGFLAFEIIMWSFNEWVVGLKYKFDQNTQLKFDFLKNSFREHRQSKITKYQHSGFGFDGEEGHDMLITDSIIDKYSKN